MTRRGAFTPRTYRAAGLVLSHEAPGSWYFDGPAFYGPRSVRRSQRGPFWRGPVTSAFAGVLLKRLRAAGMLAPLPEAKPPADPYLE